MMIDGPASPLFNPVRFEEGLDQYDFVNFGLSADLANRMRLVQTGVSVAWGVPFEIKKFLLVKHQPVSLIVAPFVGKWIVFRHTSDIRDLPDHSKVFTSPMRGGGFLGELAAKYSILYRDGSTVTADILRRRQVGAFSRRWGENCFEAVAASKPHPVRASHEQSASGWGRSQTRVDSADNSDFDFWLWAWENPFPDKEISGFKFEPVNGALIISAISSGIVSSHPFRWDSRRKAVLRITEGQKFLPELDAVGCLKQISMDLGQIISALPRPDYPHQDWENSYPNQLPIMRDHEVLIEYTSHPEAFFYINDLEKLPVGDVNANRQATLTPVAPASKLVRLRIVEKGSGIPVPVKLHIHGEAGEYLAPTDRHRIINPAWFEDYSADFIHQEWNKPGAAHPCAYIPGETVIKLPLGKIYLEISKGFEIRPHRIVYDITPASDVITIEIEKILPWREKGWVSADTHVHFLSPMTALLEGSAEGVNVINLLASQWGELMTNVGDFDGVHTWGSKESGGSGEYLVRVGTENRQHVMGHISLLGYHGSIITPMTVGGPDESAIGDPVEILLTEWARQCHTQDGLVVLPHFPNPRAEHAASIVSGDIDAIEMTSWENFYGGIDPYSLSDWYRYLNCGYLVPVVGGTDKMDAATAVGTVRTYAWLDPRSEFTYNSWKEAIRKGNTFVTYGPLLEFNVDGHPMGSRFSLSNNGGTVQVSWQVASVTVPVTSVELVVNGEIKERLAVPPQGGTGYWSFKVEKSCWLALLVRGHYHDQPEIIAAHSSPVMILLPGAPLIASADSLTILEQIEGSLAYLDTIGTRADDIRYKKMRMVLQSAYRTLHHRMHLAGYFHGHTPVDEH